jgi:hypothetical protein
MGYDEYVGGQERERKHNIGDRAFVIDDEKESNADTRHDRNTETDIVYEEKSWTSHVVIVLHKTTLKNNYLCIKIDYVWRREYPAS